MPEGKRLGFWNHPVVHFIEFFAAICGIVWFIFGIVTFATGKFSLADFSSKGLTGSPTKTESPPLVPDSAAPSPVHQSYLPPSGAEGPSFKKKESMQRLSEADNPNSSQESGSVKAAVLALAFAGEGARAYVPMVIEINGESLLAEKQVSILPVEISINATDQNGSLQDSFKQKIMIDLAKAEVVLRQSGLKFFCHLDLPPGTYSLRTLVRNGATGASGLWITSIKVPDFAKGEAILLPALFPEPPGRWVMVRETPHADAPQAPYPFKLKDQPYIPSSLPTLIPGQATAIVLEGYNFAAGTLRADIQVLSADGQELPGGSLNLANKEVDGAVRLLRVAGTFYPPRLKPGEYVLRVTLIDDAGMAETSRAWFSVVEAARMR